MFKKIGNLIRPYLKSDNSDTEVDVFTFKAKAFGIADKTEDCVAGTISSSIPFQKGQLHRLKGKQWSVTSVEKNHLDETLVKMKLAS